MADNILRLAAVKARTGLSRSVIYKRMRLGTFPQSIPLGPRTTGWIESEIDEWISENIRRAREPEGREDARPAGYIPRWPGSIGG